MSNKRTIFDNAIERATLSSPDTAGVMVPANLQNGRKSRTWRTAGTLATIAALWGAPEAIRAVIWPFVNWSDTSQMRIRVSCEDTVDNRIRYSETFDNTTYWSSPASANVIGATGIVSPSGSTNVDKLQEITTTAEAHSVAQSVSNFNVNEQVTFSIFAKQAERSFISLKFDSVSTAAPATATVIFSLTNGSKYSETSGGWTFSIDPYLDGWWRIIATRTTTASGIIRPIICTASSSTSSTHAGVVGQGIYIWGAMLNKGPKSSYYPNTGSAAPATRPAGYIDSWQSYDYDSGLIQACPAPARKLRRFTAAQAAGAFSNGGGNYAWHWLPAELQARGLSVTISDPGNLQGYLEAAFLVAGPYWEASYNPTAMPMGTLDRTTIGYSRAGDQWADAGDLRRKLNIELSRMAPEDRVPMVDLMMTSRAYPILVALFPDHPDPALCRDNMVYGRRAQDSDISPDVAFTYSMSIPLEEV